MLCAFYAVFGGEYPIPTLFHKNRELRSARAQQKGLEEVVDSLSVLRRALESDPRTIEREARERYGLIADGEILFRFVAEDGTDWKTIFSDSSRSE